jgi:hypothetical protein
VLNIGSQEYSTMLLQAGGSLEKRGFFFMSGRIHRQWGLQFSWIHYWAPMNCRLYWGCVCSQPISSHIDFLVVGSSWNRAKLLLAAHVIYVNCCWQVMQSGRITASSFCHLVELLQADSVIWLNYFSQLLSSGWITASSFCHLVELLLAASVIWLNYC